MVSVVVDSLLPSHLEMELNLAQSCCWWIIFHGAALRLMEVLGA